MWMDIKHGSRIRVPCRKGLFCDFIGVRESLNKKTTLKVMEFSIMVGGRVYTISITFSENIMVLFQENFKDDQNGIIHPEN